MKKRGAKIINPEQFRLAAQRNLDCDPGPDPHDCLYCVGIFYLAAIIFLFLAH